MTHFYAINLLGWPAMLLLAWAISFNRKQFPWRTVIWGLGLQFMLAVLVLAVAAFGLVGRDQSVDGLNYRLQSLFPAVSSP